MLSVLEASPPAGMPSLPDRYTICAALAEQIVSERHTIRIQNDPDEPLITIIPKVKRTSPRDMTSNPATYWIWFDEDNIRIDVNRATGVRTIGTLQYEDPRMLDQLSRILSRLGVRFIS